MSLPWKNLSSLLGMSVALACWLGCETSKPPESSAAPAQPVAPTVVPAAPEELSPEVPAAPPPLSNVVTEPSPPASVANEPVAEEPRTETPSEQPAVELVAAKPPAEAVVALEKPSIKERAPLFVDWPQPDFVLVFSGQQLGYIEPCGCTGLANQKGGLARRHTFLKHLEGRGWPVVPLDVGNQVRSFGGQQEIKFQRTAEGLRTQGYLAAALGANDLKLATLSVFSATNVDDKPSLFTAANVALIDRTQTPEYKVATVGDKRIGVVAVLGDSHVKTLAGDELIRTPTAESLPAVAEKLAAEKCDLQILLAHATLEETAALAKKYNQFALVATSGGIGDPPLDIETIDGAKSKQVQVGTKGMYVMAVGVYLQGQPRFRTERVPLDDRWEDSPAMRKLMAEYQEQLKSLGFEALGLKPQPHPTERKFVGTATCGVCHTQALAKWKETPHAHATDALIHPKERGDVPRHFDPECLSCHATGWEPQKMYPYVSGYLSLEKTPKLQHNGCENCHGPGDKHAEVEAGNLAVPAAEQQKLRDELKLPLAGGKARNKCLECHDIDNSPDFHAPGAFEKYWEKVAHPGKD